MLLSCDTMRVSLRCTLYGHYQHSKYNKKLTSYNTQNTQNTQKVRNSEEHQDFIKNKERMGENNRKCIRVKVKIIMIPKEASCENIHTLEHTILINSTDF